MVSMAVPTNQTSRRQVILFTMSLGVFIAQLDSQVVNLAIKAIGSDLNAGINALQWVLDSYNLFYATLLLTGGTLGDLYGRTRVFATGIGLIVLGSIVCAAAPNDAILIAGRAITGVGAALEVPTSLAILTVAYADDKERARAIGIWASCNGLALAAGPTVGGLLVDAAGWRSIFILVVPVSVLAMVLAMRRVPESSDPQGRHLDPAGQALAIAALGTLSFVTIEGPHWGFASPIILALAVACVVSGVLFVASQHGRPGALVPLDFFRDRVFNAALAVAGMMTFGMYAMLFLTPLYLQSLGGISAFMVGLALLPLSVTFVIVSQYSGALMKRFGARDNDRRDGGDGRRPPPAYRCFRNAEHGADRNGASHHRRRPGAQYWSGQYGRGGERATGTLRHSLGPDQHVAHGGRHARCGGAWQLIRRSCRRQPARGHGQRPASRLSGRRNR